MIKMTKNLKKAIIIALIGVVGSISCILSITAMYMSATFLPVYIGSVYVIGNQIVRYVLYAMLLGALILSVMLANHGISFIIKKFRKIKRR